MTILKNKHGEGSIWIAVIVILVCMILAVALFFAGVEIQVIGIRNTVKAELANLSVEIADDTYKALRESNFEAYREKLC